MERQEEECREFCARMGWQVGQVFADNDLSATSGVLRPSFERLLASRPEVVVCWHSDRFIRLMSDLERVIELGVNVHAVHVGNLDLSTPSGRMVARIVTSVAQHEGEQRALRQRAAARQKAALGKPSWARAPIGYTLTGEIVPEEAKRVQEGYASVLDGKSLYAIAQDWNGQDSRHWTGANVRRLLLSARNAGISTYHGEEVGQGDWEPLVPVETFRAAESLLKTSGRWANGQNRTGRRPSSMLAALARCGVCDSPIRTQRHASRTDAYVCGSGGHVYAPIDMVDSLVLWTVVEGLKEEDVARYWLEQGGDEGERSEWLSRAAVLRARQEESALAYAQGALTLSQLTTITSDLVSQVNEAENSLAQWRPVHLAKDLLDDVEILWQRLDEMTLEDLRQLVAEVCTSVRILPREGRRVGFTRRHLEITLRT